MIFALLSDVFSLVLKGGKFAGHSSAYIVSVQLSFFLDFLEFLQVNV